MNYDVVVNRVAARPLAVVRRRVAIRDIPSHVVPSLDQVYAVAKRAGLVLDGQNVIVYRNAADGFIDAEFGVGVARRFVEIEGVEYSEAPAGEVAIATHYGDYSKLRGAYDALAQWCKSHGRPMAPVQWEIYGHWTDDPAQLRTDVCYLLGPEG